MADAARSSLIGRHVIVTRPGSAGLELVAQLTGLGAVPHHCPAITFADPDSFSEFDSVVAELSQIDWVFFTSAVAVHAFAARLLDVHGRIDIRLPALACIGNATRDVVRGYGWTPAFVSIGGTSAALAAEAPVRSGARVVIPHADIASPALADALRARGLDVKTVVAYHTIPDSRSACGAELLRKDEADAITFASPSSITYFLDGAASTGLNAVDAIRRRDVFVVCIGNTTAAAARSQGLPVSAVALTPSHAGMIDALATCFQAQATQETVFA